jgi:hypothetical protein
MNKSLKVCEMQKQMKSKMKLNPKFSKRSVSHLLRSWLWINDKTTKSFWLFLKDLKKLLKVLTESKNISFVFKGAFRWAYILHLWSENKSISCLYLWYSKDYLYNQSSGNSEGADRIKNISSVFKGAIRWAYILQVWSENKSISCLYLWYSKDYLYNQSSGNSEGADRIEKYFLCL